MRATGTPCGCQADGTCRGHEPKALPVLTTDLVQALERLRRRTETHPRIGTSREEDAIVAAWQEAS